MSWSEEKVVLHQFLREKSLHEELKTRPSTGARALMWESVRQDPRAHGRSRPVLSSDAASSCLVLNVAWCRTSPGIKHQSNTGPS